MTRCLLCVIPSILEDTLVHSNGEHMKQVNIFIKTFFHGLSEDKINETIEKIWTEYIAFNNKSDPFDINEFIWSNKDIRDGNIHIWHQNYYLPFTRMLGYVVCRVTPKILGIGPEQHSWGDVKTIKSEKRLATISDVSRKQSIVYTSAYIESSRNSHSDFYHIQGEYHSRHAWNYNCYTFDQQLKEWGADSVTENKVPDVTR